MISGENTSLSDVKAYDISGQEISGTDPGEGVSE
jgi:hypothetical protein